jgi:hypothetical protein
MIKARGEDDKGNEFVLLGLSWGNLDRLREGSPIRFDGRPYGIPMDVIIMADETEQKLAKSLVQTDTKVNMEK